MEKSNVEKFSTLLFFNLPLNLLKLTSSNYQVIKVSPKIDSLK
jgi:hypothetical protein